MNTVARKGIIRLLIWQLVVTGIMALLFGYYQGVKGGYSAIIGGLVCIIPNLYFALRVFRYNGAKAAVVIVKSFYKGEAIKLLMTMALFAVVFKWIPIAGIAFFVTFIVVQWMYWIAPWLFFDKRS